jgi:hypothetical protein
MRSGCALVCGGKPPRELVSIENVMLVCVKREEMYSIFQRSGPTARCGESSRKRKEIKIHPHMHMHMHIHIHIHIHIPTSNHALPCDALPK